MTQARVTVVGSVNADVTMLVDRLPGPGETVLTSAPSKLSFGGKGGNQAAAAAALGGAVRLIGRVGDDDAGRAIRADFISRGVDVSRLVTVPGAHTGSAAIAVDPGGENLIIVDPGANSLLGPDGVSPAAVGDCSVILAQLEIPLDTINALIATATAPVVLNPAPAVPLPQALLERVAVLVANMTELALLTGVSLAADMTALAAAASTLHAEVVVTLGSGGALVVPRAPGVPVHIPAPQAVIRDATGAGDCFCGTLAVLLAEGAALAEAARLSVAAATLSATGTGARGRLPSREEAAAVAADLRIRELTRL